MTTGAVVGQKAGEDRSTLTWGEYVSLVLALLVALCAVFTKTSGLFLDRAVWLGLPLAVATVVGLVALDPLCPRRRVRNGLPRVAEASDDRRARLALAATQLVVVAVFLARIGVDLVPRAASSDFGSHGGIVTWIAQHQAMPSASRWSSSVASYPSGGHLAAATLTWVSPLRPLEALWAMTLVALLGTWPILCLLARQVAWHRSWVASAFVLAFLFGAYRYTIGIVTYDYFFAQLVGQWLALAGVARVVVEMARLRSVSRPGSVSGWGSVSRPGSVSGWGSGVPERHLGTRPLVAVVWVLGFLAGAVLSYPQASVLLIGTVGAVILFGPLARRVRYGLMVASVVLASIFLAALSRTVYWSADLLAGFPGEVSGVRLQDVGGPLMVGLAAVGGVMVFLRVFLRGRRAPQNLACLGAAAGPLAVVVAMISLRAGFPVRLAVSDYRIAKNVYGLVPLLVVFAAVGAAELAGWVGDQLGALVRGSTGSRTQSGPDAVMGLPTRHPTPLAPWLATLAAALAAVLSLGSVRAPTAAVRRIYERDLYRLGLTIPASDRASVGLVAPWVEVYVLRWAGIGTPVSTEAPAEFPRTERWRTWPDGQVTTDRLLVAGPFAQKYRNRPGVVVEHELGSAVLLRRR